MKNQSKKCFYSLTVLLFLLSVLSAPAFAKRNFMDAFSGRLAVPVTDHPKILMIGNSLTHYNDLPGTLQKLCRENGIQATVSSAINLGHGLTEWMYPDKKHHCYKSDIRKKERMLKLLTSQKWDYVILQGRSDEALEDPGTMKKAISQLYPKIKAAGAQMVLYMTWTPSKDRNAQKWNRRQSTIADVYYQIAEKYNCAVAPAGIAFARSRILYPELDLYRSAIDRKHASPAGTYLAACTFYSTLFGKSPVGTPYYPSVSGASQSERKRIGTYLQGIAEDVTIRSGVTNNASLTFSSSSYTMDAGESRGLTYTIKPLHAGGRITHWKSSNPRVAAVDASGKVTARKHGTATITAVLNNNRSARCRIIVRSNKPASNLPQYIGVGTSQDLNLHVSSGAGLDSDTYTSSHPDIISVSKSGILTAKKTGTAKITVKTYNGKRTSFTVRSVIHPRKLSFREVDSGFSLKKGQAKQLRLSFVPSNTTIQKMKWTSSNRRVLSVSQSGRIKAHRKGTATIKAAATDGSNKSVSIKIKVK